MSKYLIKAATYGQVSHLQLYYLCHALGLSAWEPNYQAVQSALMEPWSSQEVPTYAPYPSEIGDDHSPYEYSVQFARRALELRVLVESQASLPSLLNNQSAAKTLSEKLQRNFALDTSRLNTIQDLLLPEKPLGPFSLWHSACFAEMAPPAFKVYLNPRVRGGDQARGVMTEALSRLGLIAAAQPIMDRIDQLGGAPNYFSLDLARRLGSRVKIYFRHPDATISDLEAVFSLAPSNAAGDVRSFCKAIVGVDTRLDKKPVCYCFSFVEGVPNAVSVTFHLPVAHYQDSEASILRHVSVFMSEHNLPVAQYQRAVTAMARRALGDSVGLQSYASYRREASGLKFTVYLSPELFSAPYAQFPYGFREGDLRAAE